MENVLMITALVAEKKQLDKDIKNLIAHRKQIVTNQQRFVVKLETSYTTSVKFSEEEYKDLGLKMFEYAEKLIAQRLFEVNHVLAQAEALLLNKDEEE